MHHLGRHIDILPESYSQHPLMWDNEDFKYMAILEAKVELTRTTLEEDYERIKSTLFAEFPDEFPLSHFTLERYIWAYLTVTTRAWAVTNGQGQLEMTLVPLADMLNHKVGNGEGGMNFDNSRFIINATTTYAPGEQVYDSYGPKTNFQLLSEYGFLPETNPANGAVVSMQLNSQNIVHQHAIPMLKASDPNYNQIKVTMYEVPQNLLRICRITALKFSELKELDNIIAYKAISLENEFKAFRIAVGALISAINQYPTQEEEEALLASPDVTDRQKLTIRVRVGEKQVLERQIETIKILWQKILLDGELLGGVAI